MQLRWLPLLQAKLSPVECPGVGSKFEYGLAAASRSAPVPSDD